MGRSHGFASLTRRVTAALLLGTLMAAVVGCSSLSGGRSTPAASTGQTALLRAQSPDSAGAAKSGAAPQPGAPSAPAESGVAGQASTSPKADQMIIRNADMRLEVAKVSDTADKIRGLAKKYGGVIAEIQLSNESGTPAPQPLQGGGTSPSLSSGQPFNGSITVLVPSNKFDAFTDEVRTLGKVITYRTDDQNVTEQHIDMKARLDNLKSEEARLRSMFGDAKNVGEMLAVERELARVQGEIESLSAQLAHLERQVALATLVVELTGPAPLVRPAGVDWGIGRAFTDGVQGFAAVLGFLITFFIAVLPLALLALIAILLVRWLVRRSRRVPPVSPITPETAEDDTAG